MASANMNVTINATSEDEVYYQKSMEFIFEVVLLMAVGILGLVGNISAIVLFVRLENQLKFHRLMMMLSAFDTLYVIVSILLFAMPQISKAYIESGAHNYILPKALPFAQVISAILQIRVQCSVLLMANLLNCGRPKSFF